MKKLALFVVLSVVLSTGCNLVSSQQKGPSDGSFASNSTSASNSSKEKDYPMMPASVMQNEIKLLDDKTLKLEQYQGKAIIVNIWGTWCGPCRMEIPELMKLKDEFGDKGLEIVGLSLGHEDITEPESEVKAYVTATKINYDIGFFNAGMRTGLSNIAPIGAVPTSYLISKDGKIRAVFQGAGPKTVEKLRAAVEKAVSE
jgi:thiol-disulfide isomerase/thioredoxin